LDEGFLFNLVHTHHLSQLLGGIDLLEYLLDSKLLQNRFQLEFVFSFEFWQL
jgi:hypothetical protein